MVLAGEGILIVLTAGLLLEDLPAHGGGIILQIVLSGGAGGSILLGGSVGVLGVDAGGRLLGVGLLLRLLGDNQGLVGVAEGGLAVFSGGNGGIQLLLEVAGQEHVGGNGVDDDVADIGHIGAVLGGDAAILSQGVGYAVGGEFLSAGGGGQQGLIVELEGQGAVLGGGVHQLLAGVAHHLTVVFHGIEVVGNLGQGEVVALVGEGGLPLLDGQHSSGLGGEAKHLVVVAGVLELGVFLGCAEVTADGLIGVEELVLTIGGDQAADEGKHEHENQDDQTGDGHAVADEALGHQHTGRKDLNTTVIVQRILLLSRLLVGVLHFLADLLTDLLLDLLLIDLIFAICHFTSSSLLKRCVREDRPRRTEYQKSGYPTGSARP